MPTAYFNGQFMPLEEIRVPVLDRGFIFGDGVYEVIPVFAGHLFRLAEHLQRLENSLANIRLVNPLSRREWQTTLEKLVTLNQDGDQSIYLQVTRGPAAKRDHNFPSQVTPTVFIMSNPFKDPPPSPGIKAITRQDIRWQRCDVKTIALIANVLLRQQAVDIGAYETILLRDGYVMEGAATNVFVVYQGEVLTPPKSQFILPGITRDLVLEILRVNQFPCHEVDIPIAQLFSAEEIWITGSISGILPVITLDDKPVGIGQRGPVWTKIWGWYQSYKQMLRQN